MNDHRFPAACRVRHQTEFDRVYGNDAFAADQVLVLRGCRNDLGHSRLGLSVSRKVGPAVVRNRWKRLIREAFRKSKHEMPAGFDFVLRPRKGAEPDYRAIRASVTRLTNQLARRIERRRS